MCNIYSPESSPSYSFSPRRPYNVRVRRLNRWRRLRKGAGTKKMVRGSIRTDIQMKNLKLFKENQSIIEENERLRKKALLLHQENQTLFAQLQRTSSPIPKIASEKQEISGPLARMHE